MESYKKGQNGPADVSWTAVSLTCDKFTLQKQTEVQTFQMLCLLFKCWADHLIQDNQQVRIAADSLLSE